MSCSTHFTNRSMNLREVRWILRQAISNKDPIVFDEDFCTYMVRRCVPANFIRYLIDKRHVPTRPWSGTFPRIFNDSESGLHEAEVLIAAGIPILAKDLPQLWAVAVEKEMNRLEAREAHEVNLVKQSNPRFWGLTQQQPSQGQCQVQPRAADLDEKSEEGEEEEEDEYHDDFQEDEDYEVRAELLVSNVSRQAMTEAGLLHDHQPWPLCVFI